MSTPFAWHNGRIKPWADASVHVSTHALHYGSSMFEGERVYATPLGPAYFRLAEHTRQLFGSARVYEMAADLGIAVEERELPRETLHPAGEVFMTGNAAEITPVRNAVIPDRQDREPTIHRRTPHQQPAAMGVSA